MATSRPETLLEQVARGHAAAVSECLEHFGPLVWSIVGRMWRDPASTEDIVQEVFIDLWKSAERFDPERGSEATFVAMIARRRVIDHRRKLGRAPDHETIEHHDFAGEDAGLRDVDLGDEARKAHAALESLRPEQRRVILMSVVEGLTHREISAATGIPLGTVKSHVRRGLLAAAETLRAGQGEVAP